MSEQNTLFAIVESSQTRPVCDCRTARLPRPFGARSVWIGSPNWQSQTGRVWVLVDPCEEDVQRTEWSMNFAECVCVCDPNGGLTLRAMVSKHQADARQEPRARRVGLLRYGTN